ncbi:YpsA SLOG family protein [Thiolapillus sp.]
MRKFITNNNIKQLNIAGPRASGEPLAYAYTLETMTVFLQNHELI